MHLARLAAAGLLGVDGYVVQVEVSRITPSCGIGRTTVVGLPDHAVRESIERITPALVGAHLSNSPADNVVVNLAPADRRKEGPVFDLAIALGLAATAEENHLALPDDTLFLAELALDGSLRPVRGVLSAMLAARAAGLTRAVVAPANAAEAAVVSGIAVYAPANLRECVSALRAGLAKSPVSAAPATAPTVPDGPCLSDVRGQDHAKRALIIAAAGAHNLLFIGPPGSGKTMLARRLPGLLPPMSLDEAVDASRVHSVSGLLPLGCGLLQQRPFRAPHHTVSGVGLIGGGSIPRPGEVSLAHQGVLFLDELPEFPRTVLENLRQPLEDGFLTISRAGGRVCFPAQVSLVAAMNPCPCGYLGHPSRRCVDHPDAVHRYRNRISGPLLDRIDLHVDVPAQRAALMLSASAIPDGETSVQARARIANARAVMLARQGCANARLDARGMRTCTHATNEALQLLVQAAEELGLSARAHDRCLKVARTIADLEGRPQVEINDMAEAIGYRVLDRLTA
jgi:magnesium chelatase family protein